MSVKMGAISVAAIFNNHGQCWSGTGALSSIREYKFCSAPFRLMINEAILGMSLFGPRVGILVTSSWVNTLKNCWLSVSLYPVSYVIPFHWICSRPSQNVKFGDLQVVVEQ